MMMAMRLIESPQNPSLKQLIRLQKKRYRDKEGLFVIEGMREVSRALLAQLEIQDYFICPSLDISSTR
ncbi:MAG: hypothetical protein R2880_09690 [Deinococcales bacterium]